MTSQSSDLAAGLDFIVDKSRWNEKQYRFEEVAAPELADGEVLFRVDRFALTANNISYALTGDALGYWSFFEAPEGWGRIPAMGFGDVVRSRHAGVGEGTRCFGFFPMSRYLKIQPGSVSEAQIMDASAHRAGSAPAYNQYVPSGGDALYEAAHEDALMLLRGLFMTSFLADDFFACEDYHGAESVLISSASSKTSIALAHCVSSGGRARAVGLTSAGNLDFVRKLGCYDEVILYEDVTSLDAKRPAIFVDMAGNGGVLRAVHTHYGDALRFSSTIGATHWEAERSNESLPGPTPEFFFAPAQAGKRAADWGPEGLQERLGRGWSGFRAFTERWLQVERGYGRDALLASFEATVAGGVSPERGQVLSLWDNAEQAAGR